MLGLMAPGILMPSADVGCKALGPSSYNKTACDELFCEAMFCFFFDHYCFFYNFLKYFLKFNFFKCFGCCHRYSCCCCCKESKQEKLTLKQQSIYRSYSALTTLYAREKKKQTEIHFTLSVEIKLIY